MHSLSVQNTFAQDRCVAAPDRPLHRQSSGDVHIWFSFSSSPSSLALSWSSPTSLIFLCAFLSFLLLQRELLKNNPTLWGKRTHLSQRRSLIYSCGCVPGHTGLSVEEPRDSAQLHLCTGRNQACDWTALSLTTNVRERTICFTWP